MLTVVMYVGGQSITVFSGLAMLGTRHAIAGVGIAVGGLLGITSFYYFYSTVIDVGRIMRLREPASPSEISDSSETQQLDQYKK